MAAWGDWCERLFSGPLTSPGNLHDMPVLLTAVGGWGVGRCSVGLKVHLGQEGFTASPSSESTGKLGAKIRMFQSLEKQSHCQAVQHPTIFLL